MTIAHLIPESNRLEAGFSSGLMHTNLIADLYSEGSGFVGVFVDEEGQPTWARRAARYLRDEFRHDAPGGFKEWSTVQSFFRADGAGECLPNFRYALDAWRAEGGNSVEPYTCAQNLGSCVDASGAEGDTGLIGWRVMHPATLADMGHPAEEWRHPVAWYHYANRGYCSDGWNGFGRATVARKVGAAFRTKYVTGPNSIDFTGDDANERIVGRQWCRSGIPKWMSGQTQAEHPYHPAAISEFDGGLPEMLKVFANGGYVHTSGTRTSGGSKPFTIGSVGPHMQAAAGCDDSDNFRRWCVDVLKVERRANDYPVILHQTWGPGWRGECGDAYWPFGTDASGKTYSMAEIRAMVAAGGPTVEQLAELAAGWGWGWKPQGAWVWWASDVVRRLSCDVAYLPNVRGFPASSPVPPPGPPAKPAPPLTGTLYAEPLEAGIAIRGEVGLTIGSESWRYIAVPAGGREYRLEQKPEL